MNSCWAALAAAILGSCAGGEAAAQAPPAVPAGDLPRGAIARFEHGDQIRILRFSPDSSRIAAGGGSMAVDVAAPQQTLTLWDIDARRALAAPNLRSKIAVALAFSPDGSTLAVSGGTDSLLDIEPTVTLYDLAGGKEKTRLAGPERNLHALGFSADGRRVIAGDDEGIIWVWDAGTGARLSVHKLDRKPIAFTQFLADGNAARVAGPGRSTCILDLTSGEARERFDAGPGGILCASATPAGDTLAVGGEARIDVWDAGRGLRITTIPNLSGNVADLSISPDGRLLLALEGVQTDLYEVATGKKICPIPKAFGAVAFAPSGRRFATAGERQDIYVWDLEAFLEVPGGKGLDLDRAWVDLGAADPALGLGTALALSRLGDEGAAALDARVLAPLPAAVDLIKGLDHEDAPVREQCMKQLAVAGYHARDDLRRVLASGPSEQTKRTLDALLKRLEAPTAEQPALIRLSRAAVALERIGTRKALAVLERIADAGLSPAEDGRLRAAIHRLGAKPGSGK